MRRRDEGRAEGGGMEEREGWRRSRRSEDEGGGRMEKDQDQQEGTHTQSAVIKPGTGIDRDCRLS